MILVLHFIIFFCGFLVCESTQFFFKSYGINMTDSRGVGLSVQNSADGGFIATGNAVEESSADAFVLKTDGEGNVTWFKIMEADNEKNVLKDDINSVAVRMTPDNGFVICGSSFSYKTAQQYILIAKFTEAGYKQWVKLIGKTDGDTATSLLILDSGEIVVIGTTLSFPGPFASFMTKIDVTGAIEWFKTYGEKKTYTTFSAIHKTSDKGFLVTGNTFTEYGSSSLLVSKLDSTGEVEWIKSYAMKMEIGYYDVSGSSVSVLSDGYLIGGSYGYTSSSGSRLINEEDPSFSYMMLLKLDEDGNVISLLSPSSRNDMELTSLQLTNDGGVVVVGTNYRNPLKTNRNQKQIKNDDKISRGTFGKIKEEGSVEWFYEVDNELFTSFSDLEVTTDGNFVVAGTITIDEKSNIMLVKFDQEGKTCSSVSSIPKMTKGKISSTKDMKIEAILRNVTQITHSYDVVIKDVELLQKDFC